MPPFAYSFVVSPSAYTLGTAWQLGTAGHMEVEPKKLLWGLTMFVLWCFAPVKTWPVCHEGTETEKPPSVSETSLRKGHCRILQDHEITFALIRA